MSVDEDEVDASSTKELVAYLETADQWNNVAEVIPNFKDVDGESNVDESRNNDYSSPLVSMQSVIQYLNSGVLDEYLHQVTHKPRTTWELIYSCMCTRPGLPPNLQNSKQAILATALIPFSNETGLHLSILRTLYRQLTGSKLDCPRYGHHWEDIGFQGNDPSTDLRGVGVLGLVNALYFVVTPQVYPLAKQIYNLSLSPAQEFPLMVLSLNATRICLHILRDGLLDSRCFKDGDVWKSFNCLYTAIMFHIYHVWKTQFKTISNSGFVLQDAEEIARKNPERMISELTKHLSENFSAREIEIVKAKIDKLTRISS